MTPKPGVPEGGGHRPGQSPPVEPRHDPQSEVNQEKEENPSGDAPPESQMKSSEERTTVQRKRTARTSGNRSKQRRTSVSPDGTMSVDKPCLKRPRSLSPKIERPSPAMAWESHNAPSKPPITCPKCNLSEDSMYGYISHCVNMHGEPIEPQPRPPAAHRGQLQLGSAGKQLNCDNCQFQTRDPDEMDHHIVIHMYRELSARLKNVISDGGTGLHRPHPLARDSFSSPQTEGKKVGRSSLGEETPHGGDTEDPAAGLIRVMKAKGEFPCGICDEVFPNLRAMKGHNRVHMQSAPYRCNVCVYFSSDKSSLTRHMKEHNGERPYECRVCKFAFTTKANCERHLKNRHQLKLRQELADNMIISSCGETSSAPVKASALQPAQRLRNVLPASQLPSLPTSLTCCSLCNLRYTDFVRAVQHVQLDHPTRNPRDILQPVVQRDFSSDNLAARAGAMNPSQNASPAFCPVPPVLSFHNLVTSVQQAPPKMSLTSPVVPFVETESGPAHQASSLSVDARRLLHAQLLVQQDDSKPLDLSRPRESSPSGPPAAKCQRVSSPEEQSQPLPLECDALASSLSLARVRMMAAHLGLINCGMRTNQHLSRNIPAEMCSNAARGLQLGSGGEIMSHQQGVLHLQMAAIQQARNILSRGDANLAEIIRLHPAFRESTSASMNGHDAATPTKPKQMRYRLHKPYSCSYCEARFTLSTNMDRHVKNRHPDKWEKKQRCPRTRSDTGGSSQSSNHDNDQASSTPKQTEESGENRHVDNEKTSEMPDDGLASISKLVDSAQTETVQQSFQSSAPEREDLPPSPAGPDSSPRSDRTRSCDHQSSDDASRAVSSGESDSGTERRRSAYSSAPHKIPCRFCHREFPWNSSLKRHELTHSGEKPYSCPHCCILFTTKSNCDRHMSRKHGGTSTSEGETHGPLHAVSQLPHKCALCLSETFSSVDDLARHLERTHGGGGGGSSPVARLQFWCHVCEERFHRLDTARQHVEVEHGAAWADLQRCSSNWVPEIAGEDQPSEHLLCIVCLRGFDCAKELGRHVHDEHLVESVRTTASADGRCTAEDVGGAVSALECGATDGALVEPQCSGAAATPPSSPDHLKTDNNLNDMTGSQGHSTDQTLSPEATPGTTTSRSAKPESSGEDAQEEVSAKEAH